MNRRFLHTVLPVLLLSAVLSACFLRSFRLPASAEDASRSYLFDLTANGGNEVTVKPGDIITVSLHLKRTDSDISSVMYAVQDEISYDENCFKLVKNGGIAAENIRTADLGRKDSARAYYMNFVSVTGGELWEADTVLGMFQLEVIGKSGRSAVESKNYLVSTQDGTDCYLSSAKDLSVIIKGDMTVRFDTNGGSERKDTVVAFGDRIPRPEDPEKKGYIFFGWYRDAECTQLWNFETDVVEEDMTLYAKWTEKPVSPILWVVPVAAVLLVIILLLVCKRRKEKP